jgi:hypothetical protein
MLLVYAIHRQDPVFMLGQGMGTFIYLRNLQLISKERRRLAAAVRAVDQEAQATTGEAAEPAVSPQLRSAG